MANRADYYVISYDEGEALPYGFAWFTELGLHPSGGPAFTYFATREECVARAHAHCHYVNPVLLTEG